jgi:hypothetical protein
MTPDALRRRSRRLRLDYERRREPRLSEGARVVRGVVVGFLFGALFGALLLLINVIRGGV